MLVMDGDSVAKLDVLRVKLFFQFTVTCEYRADQVLYEAGYMFGS